MKAIFSAIIHNLKYEGRDISFLGFNLSANQDLLGKEILLPDFKKGIGLLMVKEYKSNPFFFYVEDLNLDENSDTEENDKMLSNNLELYLRAFQSLMDFLWLIKDNACSITSMYAYLPDSRKVISSTLGQSNSNNQGQIHSIVEFSEQELLRAITYLTQSSPLFYHNNIKPKINSETKSKVIIPRSIIPHDHTKVNRIEGAYNFLRIARGSTHLPQKIGFYICIYETLFYAKSSGEIVHQIAERVALYCTNARFMRLEMYKLIKKAYGIRSAYFHGNTIKEKKVNLKYLSERMDHLSRLILQKVFLDDSQIFSQDSDKLESSFMDLLFEDEREPDGLTIETGIDYLRFNK